MANLITWFANLMFAWTAPAIIMEPTHQAADALGYEVAGEFEFPRGSDRPREPQPGETLSTIAELCPRLSSGSRGVSVRANFVVFAWSDREFPPPEVAAYPALERRLAHARAQSVERQLRAGLSGDLRFELVNMTSRQPHPVRVGKAARVAATSRDAKDILRIAGAAPTDEFEFGLFGEYAQRSKAVVFVDCHEAFAPTIAPPARTLRLAGRRGETPERNGAKEYERTVARINPARFSD